MTTGLVNVVSHNVNGILNPMKRRKILSKMKKEKAGIVFLQEIHLSEPGHAKLEKWGSTKSSQPHINLGREEGCQFEIKDKEGTQRK